MTEDEAKKKWCPMVRIGVSSDRNWFDNHNGNNVFTYCISSDCMMWRQDLTREEAENGYKAASGFCGLGGRP